MGWEPIPLPSVHLINKAFESTDLRRVKSQVEERKGEEGRRKKTTLHTHTHTEVSGVPLLPVLRLLITQKKKYTT